MPTVETLLGAAIARLRASGSETPRLDAEVLLGSVLGIDRTTIAAHPEAPVGDAAAARFESSLARRIDGEPVAYIRGIMEFRGLALGVDARALIPRPETEVLVEAGVEAIAERLTSAPRPAGAPPLLVVDVGTGSGAVAIAVAAELRKRRMLDDVELVASDVSADALGLARENAVAHAVADRIRFENADLLPDAAGQPWDVVLANLPYVRSGDLAGLPRATSYEPPLALDGGPDGLRVIARLLEALPTALAEGGVALLEIGADEEAGLRALVAHELPSWPCEVRRDLAGLPRLARIIRGGVVA